MYDDYKFVTKQELESLGEESGTSVCDEEFLVELGLYYCLLLPSIKK